MEPTKTEMNATSDMVGRIAQLEKVVRAAQHFIGNGCAIPPMLGPWRDRVLDDIDRTMKPNAKADVYQGRADQCSEMATWLSLNGCSDSANHLRNVAAILRTTADKCRANSATCDKEEPCR